MCCRNKMTHRNTAKYDFIIILNSLNFVEKNKIRYSRAVGAAWGNKVQCFCFYYYL